MMPLPDYTEADIPFEGYDRRRDDRLDFPDDPRSEPDLTEVKDSTRFACEVDESAGLRDA